MSSKFIVPLKLLELNAVPALSTSDWHNLYYRQGYLKNYKSSEKDVVLDRPLDGFTPTVCLPIVATDTVLQAFEKLQCQITNLPPQVNADWLATSGPAFILNKPTIPTQVINVSGSSLYSTNPPAGPNFNTSNGIFFGQNSGQNATFAFTSNFIGYASGAFSYNSYNSNFIGYNAGAYSTNLLNSNVIGVGAGQNAQSTGGPFGDGFINLIGYNAGIGITGNNRSLNAIGYYAAHYSQNITQSNMIGLQAGGMVINCFDSVAIGNIAGWGQPWGLSYFGKINGEKCRDISFSTFVGAGSGAGADTGEYNVGLGVQAGAGIGGFQVKTGAGTSSIYIGTQTGSFAKAANYCMTLGHRAGIFASNLSDVNFFGRDAGYGAYLVNYSTFMGYRAGVGSNNLSESIFLGSRAGESSTGSYVIGLGTNAGLSNPVSNAFIINNNYIPVCVNEAAAITYYSLAPGGNTYLYWDSTNNKLEAIRK